MFYTLKNKSFFFTLTENNCINCDSIRNNWWNGTCQACSRSGADCINLNGSFSCQCLVGLEKTGNNCTGLIVNYYVYVHFTYVGTE